MATPSDVNPGSSNVAVTVLVSLDSDRSNLEKRLSYDKNIQEKADYLGR